MTNPGFGQVPTSDLDTGVKMLVKGDPAIKALMTPPKTVTQLSIRARLSGRARTDFASRLPKRRDGAADRRQRDRSGICHVPMASKRLTDNQRRVRRSNLLGGSALLRDGVEDLDASRFSPARSTSPGAPLDFNFYKERPKMLKSFEWRLPSTILFGPSKLNEIGKVVQGFGERCLIVTTLPEPWHPALVDRIGALLATSGIESHWFSGVGGNPTTDQISAGAAVAREFRADVVLGLGGGSAMDGAKAIAVEATHPRRRVGLSLVPREAAYVGDVAGDRRHDDVRDRLPARPRSPSSPRPTSAASRRSTTTSSFPASRSSIPS